MIVHPLVDEDVKEIINIAESLFSREFTDLHDEMILLQSAGCNGRTDDWMCAGGTRMAAAHAVLRLPWAWLTISEAGYSKKSVTFIEAESGPYHHSSAESEHEWFETPFESSYSSQHKLWITYLMSDWLASIPAARPPPGRIPNFNNPESRANEAIITTAASLGLMLIFVSLRMYRKVRQHQSFNGSDCEYQFSNRRLFANGWQMPVWSPRWVFCPRRRCNGMSDLINIRFYPSRFQRSSWTVSFPGWSWHAQTN